MWKRSDHQRVDIKRVVSHQEESGIDERKVRRSDDEQNNQFNFRYLFAAKE
jgi:hypothetical protein